MIAFSGVRSVTFDCWGTLIHDADPAAARSLRIESVARIAGADAERAEWLLAKGWEMHHAAWSSMRQWGAGGMAAWIAEQSGGGASMAADLREAIEHATMATGVLMVDGADETLERIREAGLRSALVCDTGLTPGHMVRTLLASHGLSLDGFVFSDEVGVPKPHPSMFEAARLIVGGGPAVHVGDLRRTDVAGARAFGLGTVRFRGVYDDCSDHPDADVVVDDLRSVPELIGL